MARTLPFVALVFLGVVSAQSLGKSREVHPKLQTWKCTSRRGCVKQNSALVLDSLAHPVHQLENAGLNCGDWGNPPNITVCPDEETCAKNCIVEGISDYSAYGITTNGGSLHMTQLNKGGAVVSPRVYLLAENEKKYEMLQLTGNEFTFDVDVSKLPCGMNGALYLSEMDKSGGKSKLNPGGAAYGGGYCDAQCFTTPFINGIGNIEGKGSCCNEMDIWETNAFATSIAPHVCKHDGLYKCAGDECAFAGECDKWGCGNNPYAVGNKEYFGPGLAVDTSRPFTVVTQFPAKNGKMVEIRRLYVQDGRVIENASVNITGRAAINYMNDEYCSQTGSADRYLELGGMETMGGALSRGMVLVFSIWWDASGFMNWLDSGNAGPCNATEGAPESILKVEPNPAITFSQIKWGELGSTFKAKGRGD